MIYDIAKELLENEYRVFIIHCGNLNQGQIQLNTDFNWDIQRVKNGHTRDFEEFDLIIVDEVQRIYPIQLKTIIDKVKTTNKKCIFAFDGKQCLSPDEIKWKNVDKINEISSNIFRLTDKIRTNKEVADFIRQLLNKNKNFRRRDYPNVGISYFSNYKDTKNQLIHFHKFGWKIPNYTPGTTKVYYYEKRYNIPNEHDTPHSVIGQEFDKVVAVIDEFFFYNDDGQLDERHDLWKNGMMKYYSQYGMLYQILTRTRKKLHLVIINNEEILKRCLDILGR